jgi:hypothetical protein
MWFMFIDKKKEVLKLHFLNKDEVGTWNFLLVNLFV